MRSARRWCVSVCLLLFAGCGTSGPNLIEAAALPPLVQGPYRVRVADLLEVAFFRTPELTQQRQVGPDGFITLNPVGQVRAAGLRLDELSAAVRDLYLDQFDDPEVVVSVVQFTALQVYVGGEVNAAGMLPYQGGLTLVQALLGAGGFRDTARLDQILLIRKDSDGQPTGSLINVDRIFDNADFGLDVALAPSDIIFVPQSRIASVNQFMRQFIRDNLPIPFALGFDVARRNE